MKNPLTLKPNNHTILFNPDCDQMTAVCRAMCCRGWDINLAFDEYKTGIYKTQRFCARDKSKCYKKTNNCAFLSFRLERKKDDTCVYLDKKYRCSIYSSRPLVCRNFSCENGFKLDPICSPAQTPSKDIEICSFEQDTTSNTKFLVNPYCKLKACRTIKNNIILVYKDLRYCKDIAVVLRGMASFFKAEEINFLFKQFSSAAKLSTVKNKLSAKFKHPVNQRHLTTLITTLINQDLLSNVF
jgi:Fe-S-cluster containining protein